MARANQMVDRLTQLIEQQARQIEQLVNRPVNNPNQERDQSSERFRRLNPPTFIEAKDPVEAENWLRTMERMFAYAHVDNVEKVTCASFMLRGSAGHWWDTLVSMGETTNLTWEEQPVKILMRETKRLRNKEVPLVRVLWRSNTIEEETWEREDEMKKKFPELF
ncbi:Uncharacterized protein Adt_05026 [Abeliophyllum distichum]|uniref:Retrotransposon gag domain-containing protein n=1 Tax=Abeliophyllum distichum TaxID=126358 RepID=A0ABD1V2X9_9LAMI